MVILDRHLGHSQRMHPFTVDPLEDDDVQRWPAPNVAQRPRAPLAVPSENERRLASEARGPCLPNAVININDHRHRERNTGDYHTDRFQHDAGSPHKVDELPAEFIQLAEIAPDAVDRGPHPFRKLPLLCCGIVDTGACVDLYDRGYRRIQDCIDVID